MFMADEVVKMIFNGNGNNNMNLRKTEIALLLIIIMLKIAIMIIIIKKATTRISIYARMHQTY